MDDVTAMLDFLTDSESDIGVILTVEESLGIRHS